MRAFKPVICSDDDSPKSIYAAAKRTKAVLYSANKGFSCARPKLPIASPRAALMAIKLLQKDLKISKKAIVTGLKKAFLIGRMQRIIAANREIIFDVAHNPESAVLLAQNLVKRASKGHNLAVLSMLSDKNITATLRPLTKIVDKWYLGALTGSRATSTGQLARCLIKAGASNFVALPTVAGALKQAIAECRIKDRIVVFGSFHTVAEGLRVFNSGD